MPRRILIADDCADTAEAFAKLLGYAGHSTRVARDGLEAVAAAESFKPDAMILDISLPKLNGYDVARRIRDEPWGKAMTLIAITGWSRATEDLQESRDSGFDHFLLKPVAFNRLEELLTLAQ